MCVCVCVVWWAMWWATGRGRRGSAAPRCVEREGMCESGKEMGSMERRVSVGGERGVPGVTEPSGGNAAVEEKTGKGVAVAGSGDGDGTRAAIHWWTTL